MTAGFAFRRNALALQNHFALCTLRLISIFTIAPHSRIPLNITGHLSRIDKICLVVPVIRAVTPPAPSTLPNMRDQIGANRVAIGANRVAIGANRVAIGANRVAIGANRDANGANRVAIGANRDAIGANRDAIGANRDAIGANRDANGARRDLFLYSKQPELSGRSTDWYSKQQCRTQSLRRWHKKQPELLVGVPTGTQNKIFLHHEAHEAPQR